MKITSRARILWMMSLLVAAALACNGVATPPAASTPTVGNPNPQPLPPTSVSPQVDAALAPGDLPAKRADQGGDVNSSPDATHKTVPGGDVFVNGLYERPFNANTMDKYFPYLDIVNFQGYKDDTWGYGAITLVDTDANGKLPAKYGVELDLNKDGRGDWLILASSPSSTTWTTQGVQAWKDTDGDVGGAKPMITDTQSPKGDGYETLAFDQGKGSNADGAWVRIASDDKKTIELAFKLSMLGSPASFSMGAWAGTDALNPAMFDFNDHMTHADAGSPLVSYTVYPLKALAEIDNTCRLAIGFAAVGNEPGLCSTLQRKPAEGAAPTNAPQQPPPPGIVVPP